MSLSQAEDAFGPIRDEATKNLASRPRTREDVNVVRRRQREANMPPPYPNGWFAALESRSLKPGQVRPLDILGELGYLLLIDRFILIFSSSNNLVS